VITLADVEAAARRLDGVAHRTPLVTSRTLDRLTGAQVVLKPENLQRGGAFKFRGAYSTISSLAADERARGVAAYSSGNHAQAVALSAQLLGAPATILMPEDAPPAKLEATRGYGAHVVTYDRYSEDREALGRALAEDGGLTLVPPYDDERVIAGQGTVALELLAEVRDLDVLVAPVGGGGLIGGCATVARALRPHARIVGVEPEAGNDTQLSLSVGERVAIEVPRTIADGLQVTSPGVLTFEINAQLVDEVVTVTDAQLVDAMRFAFERLKLVLEPSGAAGLAALLSGAVKASGRRVGIVLSGGNVGAARFAELLVS
jgi:threonine dehydratase